MEQKEEYEKNEVSNWDPDCIVINGLDRPADDGLWQ
jgi:hypothetical protein